MTLIELCISSTTSRYTSNRHFTRSAYDCVGVRFLELLLVMKNQKNLNVHRAMQTRKLSIRPAGNSVTQWCGLDSTNLYRLNSTPMGFKSAFNVASAAHDTHVRFLQYRVCAALVLWYY